MSLRKPLTITLWFMALHSLGVGSGMIILPADWIAYFEITPSQHRFFIIQGGIFHILMAVAYTTAATNVSKNKPLIIFSIIVKFSAAFFLFIYFLFVNQFLIVLGSGIVDLVMGLALIRFYYRFINRNNQ